MSLAIEIDQVAEVLLADGWHDVAWLDGRSTFDVDSYEFIDGTTATGDPRPVFLGSTGAGWVERGPAGERRAVCCPIAAVLAVKLK